MGEGGLSLVQYSLVATIHFSATSFLLDDFIQISEDFSLCNVFPSTFSSQSMVFFTLHRVAVPGLGSGFARRCFSCGFFFYVAGSSTFAMRDYSFVSHNCSLLL